MACHMQSPGLTIPHSHRPVSWSLSVTPALRTCGHKDQRCNARVSYVTLLYLGGELEMYNWNHGRTTVSLKPSPCDQLGLCLFHIYVYMCVCMYVCKYVCSYLYILN